MSNNSVWERQLNKRDDNVDASSSAQADFDSLNLQIGTKLRFLAYRGNNPTQYVSTLVGMESGQYLLIKLPRDTNNGALLNFFDGEKISIRVFSGTLICTFDSTVAKSFLAPLNCLCVVFPQNLQIKQLRREMRIKSAIKAYVTLNEETVDDPLQVELGNLSLSGGMIRSTTAIGNIDDVVTLSFSLPSPDTEGVTNVAMKAKIRNIIEDQSEIGDSFVIGTEFIEFTGTHHLLVRNHVNEALLSGRQNLV